MAGRPWVAPIEQLYEYEAEPGIREDLEDTGPVFYDPQQRPIRYPVIPDSRLPALVARLPERPALRVRGQRFGGLLSAIPGSVLPLERGEMLIVLLASFTVKQRTPLLGADTTGVLADLKDWCSQRGIEPEGALVADLFELCTALCITASFSHKPVCAAAKDRVKHLCQTQDLQKHSSFRSRTGQHPRTGTLNSCTLQSASPS